MRVLRAVLYLVLWDGDGLLLPYTSKTPYSIWTFSWWFFILIIFFSLLMLVQRLDEPNNENFPSLGVKAGCH
jgi:hypothetical protein